MYLGADILVHVVLSPGLGACGGRGGGGGGGGEKKGRRQGGKRRGKWKEERMGREGGKWGRSGIVDGVVERGCKGGRMRKRRRKERGCRGKRRRKRGGGEVGPWEENAEE